MRKLPEYIMIAISALMTVLAGNSCQKEIAVHDGSDDAYITFSTPGISMDVQTKAGAYDFLDAVPAGTSFGVLGYCLAYNPGTTEYNPNSGSSQWSLKRNLCPPNLFYKQEVEIGENGTCSYGPQLKRWYTDGTGNDGIATELSGTEDFRYTFYAYYPYKENGRTDGAESGFSITPDNAATAGAPVITYTMPLTGANENSDLSNGANVPDAMLAVQQNVQKAGRSVDFNFSHIMTGLGFQINNFSQVAETVEEAADEGVDLIIYSIKLQGTFHKSVTVDMTDAAAEISYSGTYSGTYTIFESEDGRTIPWQQDGSRGSITMEPETFLRLLPGNESSGYFGPTSDDPENPNPVLLVKYKLGDNQPKIERLNRPGNFQPRSGVRYTAQINWVNNVFVLIMQADNGENWEDGEAADGDTGNDDIVFM